MQTNTVLSLSPSFSSYSNSKIAEIAARTVDEFDSDEFSDESDLEERENSVGEDEEEFEFAIAARDSEFPSQTSADEIFQNGKIRPVYSVFNREFLLGRVKFQNQNEKKNSVRDSVSPKIRLPLRKLFLEERETTIATSLSSSTEGDKLDGVPVVNYCVWPPKAAAVAEEEGRCKKSSSARCNSKRWKLRDFLHRSNSNGSENNFVVSKENEKKFTDTPADGGKVKPAAPLPSPCNLNGGEKQRSYLSYRHDLAGFFGDVNALRKKLESF
ncbi:hypothetical protein C2S51_018568 [Perilla frutescens var. frutescens]|nr:hypothetical protein C2S51_018568 [Perilla frutescens var. frutescens]